MFKIVIIGAGQLGSRHLQGLMKSKLDLDITVVDPFETSLAIAKQRAEEIQRGTNRIDVNYFTSINAIPGSIDLAIIATTADTRLKVLQDLIDHSEVKNLLLEKVLFQDLASYDIAQDLIDKRNTNAWVNCPRRIFPVSKEIKNKIEPGSQLNYVVTGGNWGLACNAIHHIDLLSYLDGVDDITLDVSGIEKIVPGKRNGFSEIIGTLIGRKPNGSVMMLRSRDIDSVDVNVQIESGKYLWNLDEARGYKYELTINSKDPAERSQFAFPYQSEMTNVVCDAILTGDDPGLPTFSVSAKQHKTMIAAFSSVFKNRGVAGCPIT